jgi:hypothetical protein
MSHHDGMLHGRIDAMWLHVVLRARGVRYDTLRVLAEAWNEDQALVLRAIAQLAEVVEEGGPAWDAAVDDVESDLQMNEAELSLPEQDAVMLADELLAAAPMTLSARLRAARAAEVIEFPRQQPEVA